MPGNLWVICRYAVGCIVGYAGVSAGLSFGCLFGYAFGLLLVMLLVCFNSKPAIAYGLSQHNPPNYPQFPAVNPTLI